MIKKITALTFIFVCTALAWMILGTTLQVRSNDYNERLGYEVDSLYGPAQHQVRADGGVDPLRSATQAPQQGDLLGWCLSEKLVVMDTDLEAGDGLQKLVRSTARRDTARGDMDR